MARPRMAVLRENQSQTFDGPAGPEDDAPLAGIRVIDLTAVVMGPLATQTLGDYGADVIKIESPDGDIMRHASPMRSPRMGAVFLNLNRNKRSVCLDLKDPAGRDAVLALCRRADVFIHSMRPAALERLGLSEHAIRGAKEDIVFCAVTGFGTGGPYAGRPAYDDIIQAMSGLADLPARRSGGPPEFSPTILADKICGLAAYGAINAALFRRTRTGKGASIEVPMFETMTAFNLAEHLAGAMFDPEGGDVGYTRAMLPERRPYRTADGYIAVLPYSTRHWLSFFKAIGREDMCTERRVTDPAERSRSVKDLYDIIADVMPARTTEAWARILRDADVPSAPVTAIADLPRDPHLTAQDFFRSYDHPSEGRLTTTALPVRFEDQSDAPIRLPPPQLGADTRAVLADAGYSAEVVDQLIARGVAITPESLEVNLNGAE
ncbi:MAG: CoA transferase [Pseudomonadota bacterium]